MDLFIWLFQTRNHKYREAIRYRGKDVWKPAKMLPWESHGESSRPAGRFTAKPMEGNEFEMVWMESGEQMGAMNNLQAKIGTVKKFKIAIIPRQFLVNNGPLKIK